MSASGEKNLNISQVKIIQNFETRVWFRARGDNGNILTVFAIPKPQPDENRVYFSAQAGYLDYSFRSETDLYYD
jgi:hypothetical protein